MVTGPPTSPRPWLGRLALAVCVAAALAAALRPAARMAYTHELARRGQRINPAPVVATGNPRGPRVLFLGDSRAAAWPALAPDRFRTLNVGVDGETTTQVRHRTAAVLARETPAVVVIQAGINDLKIIGVDAAAAPTLIQECRTNLAVLVLESRAAGAQVILTLIFPAGPVDRRRRLVWSTQIDTAVREVNAALTEQFSATPGVWLMDPEKILRPANRTEDYQDTLHLRPAAYEKLQTALLPLIEQALAARATNGPVSSNTPGDR